MCVQADLIAGCTKTIELTERQMCDVELLSIGGFSPLRGTIAPRQSPPIFPISILDAPRKSMGHLSGMIVLLAGFMTEETFTHVLDEMRLPEQQLWGALLPPPSIQSTPHLSSHTSVSVAFPIACNCAEAVRR
eukprot:COSAG05_NODE_4795_length_1368_cov_1.492514_1_plen_133_part_00